MLSSHHVTIPDCYQDSWTHDGQARCLCRQGNSQTAQFNNSSHNLIQVTIPEDSSELGKKNDSLVKSRYLLNHNNNEYRRPQWTANSKQELQCHGVHPGEWQLQCLHLWTEADGGGLRLQEERQLGQSADPSHYGESQREIENHSGFLFLISFHRSFTDLSRKVRELDTSGRGSERTITN